MKNQIDKLAAQFANDVAEAVRVAMLGAIGEEKQEAPKAKRKYTRRAKAKPEAPKAKRKYTRRAKPAAGSAAEPAAEASIESSAPAEAQAQ